ncbi:MAG: bifunctional UDP-N-acetylmuramoyl-tripeptide:D-alanyl-D-alanine ligase/alanine racemase [Porphyromonas sp.]|nr:bifunctional UDP-N-acetylmuramoyl-tripeptide:D-alanyl-D-alanine ligase/alanine racemase [Porphyromonas sp.]
MPRYPLTTIAEVLGVERMIESDVQVAYLLTDSRSLAFPQETLFFALVTPKGDGHQYIGELYHKGVRAFVVSHVVEGDYPDAHFLQVEDTLRALQEVARWHRQQLQMPIVGITGSNGKTTLKELLYQLLKERLRVGRSPKSYNSAIGVPLSLWSLHEEQELALIEAGISKLGEMRRLEELIRPEIGILTNIGEAHQENFDRLLQKAKEKVQLFDHSRLVIYGEDQEVVRQAIEEALLSAETLTWSRVNEQATLYVRSEKLSETKGYTKLSLLLDGKPVEYEVPFMDKGTIEDLFAALLLISRVAPDLIGESERYARLEALSMRLEVVEGDEGLLMINDTYNSDFDSLKIALDFMVRRNYERRPMVLVLSPLQESSKDLEELYSRVTSLVRQYDLAQLHLIGRGFEPFLELFPSQTLFHPELQCFINKAGELPRGATVLLKGARSAHFERIVQALQRQTHQTILDVNLSKIVNNLNQHRSILPTGTKVVAMIKAQGYGVGAYEMARTLEGQGVDYFAVALVDEGKELREKGITTPIIVMNPEESALSQLLEYNLEPEVYSREMLARLTTVVEASPYEYFPIHLKWDTGMHRLGMEEHELEMVLDQLRGNTAVRVASVFTHLAAADDPSEDDFTLQQIEILRRIHERLSRGLGYRPLFHALNTSASLRFPDEAGDMVRLGIGLYGISPLGADQPMGLEPVAELRTRLLQVREVPSGSTIGYNRRGVVHRPSRIGVIPVGYADGISRALGNGRVSFRTADGTLVPTIGNVCMDTLMLDLTDAPDTVQAGDFILIFGDGLPITRLAEACGTIPYEILAGLSPRVTRRYFSE